MKVQEVSLSDQVRQFVFENYIQPARVRGEKTVTVRAGDVHRDMGLSRQWPLVCGALGTLKLQQKYEVRLVGHRGPGQGANSYFTFEV